MRTALIASLVMAGALLAAGCGGGDDTAATTATASTSTTATAAGIAGCETNQLGLLDSSGATLTIGADNPAYPPWFVGEPTTKPWKVSDPNSGKGYESAVAYAVAKQLGISKANVKWTVTPFNNSFRPGKKSFDFYITQVSYNPQRAKAVDFSKGYYFVNQSVVGRKGKPIASVTSINDLKAYKLGAQVGTTSYDYIVDQIKPDSSPKVYDTNDAAVQALKNGQIDGLVVDLPTAFYVTAVQVPDGKVIGQFPAAGAKEHFGLVLPKGSNLTACADKALDQLWANGTIDNLKTIWLSKATGAPVLK